MAERHARVRAHPHLNQHADEIRVEHVEHRPSIGPRFADFFFSGLFGCTRTRGRAAPETYRSATRRLPHSRNPENAEPEGIRSTSRRLAAYASGPRRSWLQAAATARDRSAGVRSLAASSRSAARTRNCRCAAGPAALGRKHERSERRFPTLLHEHANRGQHRELGRRFGSTQAGSVRDELRALRGRSGALNATRKRLPSRVIASTSPWHRLRQAGSPHARGFRSNRTEPPRPLSKTSRAIIARAHSTIRPDLLRPHAY